MHGTNATWAPAEAGPNPLEPVINAAALLTLVGIAAWRVKRRQG